MNDRMDEIRSTRAPTLREDQIELLRRYGQKRKTEVGDVLFRAADTQNDFIVILPPLTALEDQPHRAVVVSTLVILRDNL
jgi:hypothetical protein